MTFDESEADGRAMEDVAKRENPKYAVVPWASMNAESWRHTDTPLSST
jgi:hypothetical protein